MTTFHHCRIISFLKSLSWTDPFGNSVDHDGAKIFSVLITYINALDNLACLMTCNAFVICKMGTNILKERAASVNFLRNVSINQNTRRHTPEFFNFFYIHRRENLNVKNIKLESFLVTVHCLCLPKDFRSLNSFLSSGGNRKRQSYSQTLHLSLDL